MGRARGLGLLVAATLIWVFRATVWVWIDAALQRLVKWRLGGSYRVRVNVIDTLRPLAVADDAPRRKVAVIGGGLAGVAAASTLAERGLDVTLYEAAPQLGGKLSAWTHTFDDGETWPVEHGYHAFFDNYYNLNRFLSKLGLDDRFARTTDYLILTRDGQPMSFADLHRTPGLNLVHLALSGFFDPKALVVDNPGVDRLNDMLTYDPDDTFARIDEESYAAYADAAGLPERMRLIFRSFTRVFFAEAHQMSMAELVKSFHGYFLSHDHGLMYRYPTDDHATSLWAPIAAHLDAVGVRVELGKAVGRITRQKNGRLRIGNARFDDVVLATALPGAQAILDASAELVDDEAPGLRDDVRAIQPQNRYAVLRVWLDTDLRPGLPGFVSTDRVRALDSITSVHRNERSWQRFVAERGGAVLELHGYSLPPDLVDDDAITEALMADLVTFLPELAGAQVRRSWLSVKDDFTPFFTGMHARRPGTRTGVDGLFLAGDWVKLREPVMLMEGAFTAGLHAANAVLERAGLRAEPIYSVPSRGLLHGIR